MRWFRTCCYEFHPLPLVTYRIEAVFEVNKGGEMTKWEYRYGFWTPGGGVIRENQDWLNDRGAEGWELVSMGVTEVGSVTSKCAYVLKRPIESDDTPVT